MKSINIVKKLEKEGYNIIHKKWGHWDSVPHVQLEGFEFVIAEYTYQGGWLSCNLDFIFNEVQQALYIAKNNNPIILKKIKEVPMEGYSRYLILNMKDYYLYKQKKFPFDDYYKALEKLKNEI